VFKILQTMKRWENSEKYLVLGVYTITGSDEQELIISCLFVCFPLFSKIPLQEMPAKCLKRPDKIRRIPFSFKRIYVSHLFNLYSFLIPQNKTNFCNACSFGWHPAPHSFVLYVTSDNADKNIYCFAWVGPVKCSENCLNQSRAWNKSALFALGVFPTVHPIHIVFELNVTVHMTAAQSEWKSITWNLLVVLSPFS